LGERERERERDREREKERERKRKRESVGRKPPLNLCALTDELSVIIYIRVATLLI
jgi:hypothetical protein